MDKNFISLLTAIIGALIGLFIYFELNRKSITIQCKIIEKRIDKWRMPTNNMNFITCYVTIRTTDMQIVYLQTNDEWLIEEISEGDHALLTYRGTTIRKYTKIDT